MHRCENFVHFVDKIGKLLTYAFLPLLVAKLSAELRFPVFFSNITAASLQGRARYNAPAE